MMMLLLINSLCRRIDLVGHGVLREELEQFGGSLSDFSGLSNVDDVILAPGEVSLILVNWKVSSHNGLR